MTLAVILVLIVASALINVETFATSVIPLKLNEAVTLEAPLESIILNVPNPEIFETSCDTKLLTLEP